MYITEYDVRAYVKDQVEGDNPLFSGELRYTPEEIQRAMVTAGREFNSLPPIGVLPVDPNFLPGDTNVFLDGTVAALLRATLLRETANDISVQAGNVSVQVSAVLIGHLKTLIPMFEQRFKETATNVKISANLIAGFGSVGGTLY